MSDNDSIALIATLFFCVLPIIIAMVLRHQRRMAEIIHANRGITPETAVLVQQMQELRDLVAQQALIIDNVAQQQRSLLAQPNPDLSTRLEVRDYT